MNDAIFPMLYCSYGLCSSLYTNRRVNRHTRRERVSSAMDGELKYFHVVWIPAFPAGMTDLYITMSAGARKR